MATGIHLGRNAPLGNGFQWQAGVPGWPALAQSLDSLPVFGGEFGTGRQPRQSAESGGEFSQILPAFSLPALAHVQDRRMGQHPDVGRFDQRQ